MSESLSTRIARFLGRQPYSQVREIEDALQKAEAGRDLAALRNATSGITIVEDLFNDGTNGLNDKAIDAPGERGPMESASGGGAARMVRDYAEPERVQSALVAAYKDMGRRMESLEKAVLALTDIAVKASGGSFPSDAEGKNGTAERHGDTDADRENEDSRDVENLEKGKIRISSIPKMMDSLSRQSRIAPPPSFAKAGTPAAASLQDRIERAALPLSEQMLLDSALAMQRAAAMGHADRTLAADRMRALPPHLHALLAG